MMAGVVKHQSAITTVRVAKTMVRMSFEKLAISMKKAVPMPVPNSTVEDRICSHLTQR